MDMKTLRFLPLPLLLALGLVLAGCGGSSAPSVPQDAVAVVGTDTITKAEYNTLIDSAKSTYAAKKQAFPKVGTTAYKSLSDQAMTYLVQESELTQKGKQIGVTVTNADVDKRIAQIKKQYFANSESKYKTALKQQGLTEPQLRRDLFAELLSEKLYAKVTSSVKVTDADVKQYYQSHISAYRTPESRTVRHILVNSKSQADQLEAQLKHGADFAALAKKYSKDTSTAKVGGKLTISKGQTVKPFEDAAFSLKTNEISAPVHSQYGWHIIQPLGPIVPSKTTPLATVSASIKTSLLSQKKTQTMQNWVDALKKQYASKIAYQTGYAPATQTAGTTLVEPTTTG
ncbi:MAG: peptidylprolyl isomerase [Actinobacteria bacterium]|nr:peptidylprolyl isomerase [Actinomycetota bacterium]